MTALRSRVERVASADAAILILGENGTGKELVARAIHELSPRRAHPFVKMNCAAVPAELVESELFGHEKGAFSGALAQRRGRFEQADGGTLFLDEIGDMPAPMQAKLLRVLQDGEITRVGGTGVVKVDVRVLSATNQDMDALLAAGRFREDLLYRINTVSIRVPALRDHAPDIPALVAHFGRAAAERNHWKPRVFSPAAVELLQRQPWKGNVRELRNVVERALILSDADPIGAEDVRQALPGAAPPHAAAATPAEGALADLVERYEREVIRQRLKQAGGHVTNAARSLGLERSHLYKKCRQLGIDIREEG
jgi:DNA-binding NtrC family response regulator